MIAHSKPKVKASVHSKEIPVPAIDIAAPWCAHYTKYHYIVLHPPPSPQREHERKKKSNFTLAKFRDLYLHRKKTHTSLFPCFYRKACCIHHISWGLSYISLFHKYDKQYGCLHTIINSTVIKDFSEALEDGTNLAHFLCRTSSLQSEALSLHYRYNHRDHHLFHREY